MRNRRPFTTDDARAAWNEAAEAWVEFVESGADYYRLEVHGPALIEACLPVDGRDVLDLGCGQGYLARELAHRGARVVGVDIAERLVEYAREHEARDRLGIEYRRLAGEGILGHWPPGSFDLVASCMAVQDMADIPAVLKVARGLLRDDGRMVFSVPHPATDTPFREWERDAAGEKICLKVNGYFETGPAVCRWNMPRLHYHWDTPYWRCTLGEWSDLIGAAGLAIDGLREPRPTAEQVERRPELSDSRMMPFFLIFELSKGGEG